MNIITKWHMTTRAQKYNYLANTITIGILLLICGVAAGYL